MKKMKEKKIHPDQERKMQNRDMQMQTNYGLKNPTITNDQNAVNNELASLLLIQGIHIFILSFLDVLLLVLLLSIYLPFSKYKSFHNQL